ncbi:MAG TPA: AsmA family protein [Acidobacteriaceae bacterium]|nr:AsmA family protein [Acidobacteriaceae bacterium]
MKTRLKIALVVLAGIIVVGFAVGWHWLHNPDRYLPAAIANAEKRTGLQFAVRHADIRYFPLRVRLYGLEIKNPKPFPAGDFLKVPMLEASVKLIPLLFQQKIAIRSLVLHQPAIDFISDPDGLWNFQNPAGPKNQPSRFSTGTIANLEVQNGVLLGSNLIDPSDKPGPVILELQNICGDLKQIQFHPHGRGAPLKAIQGRLTASNAGFGSIHTRDLSSDVRILPLALVFKNFQTTTYRGTAHGDFTFNFQGKQTTFRAKMNVTGVGMPYLLAEFENGPPKMTGMLQATLDVGGEIAHSASPLGNIYGTGTLTVHQGELPGLDQNASMKQIEQFRIKDAAGKPASAFSTFGGDMELKNHRIYSKRVAVDFYGIDVDGTGSMSLIGGPLNYRGSATIEKKQGLFTTTFARLFKGAKKKDGRLKFPFTLTGTLANPQFAVVH